MTLENISKTVYSETVEDLRAKIESRYGSVSAFCKSYGIDKFNLYKIFNSTKGQEMSVGLFARIMTALGVQGLEASHTSALSLKQYLEIDNNAVLKSILAVKFS
tara:strand:- start:5382 stop:5693 length:312 start_codon:yes stop_codon:yes gene_type:complete